MLAAIANGALRDVVFLRLMGDPVARAVSCVVLIAVIFAVTRFSLAWIRPASLADAWKVGAVWLALTLTFEFIAGHYVFRTPWSALLADYDLLAGRLWIFVLLGIEGSVEQGVLASRKGGHVVVVGYVVPEVVAPMVRLVYDEVSVTGSRSSTPADMQAAIDLVAEGRLRPVIGREFELSDVNEALHELRAGNIIGRPVVTFPG